MNAEKLWDKLSVNFDKRVKKYIERFGDDAINDLWPYKSVEEMTSAIKTFLDVRGEEINAR